MSARTREGLNTRYADLAGKGAVDAGTEPSVRDRFLRVDSPSTGTRWWRAPAKLTAHSLRTGRGGQPRTGVRKSVAADSAGTASLHRSE